MEKCEIVKVFYINGGIETYTCHAAYRYECVLELFYKNEKTIYLPLFNVNQYTIEVGEIDSSA